jgi:hypothetical protein
MVVQTLATERSNTELSLATSINTSVGRSLSQQSPAPLFDNSSGLAALNHAHGHHSVCRRSGAPPCSLAFWAFPQSGPRRSLTGEATTVLMTISLNHLPRTRSVCEVTLNSALLHLRMCARRAAPGCCGEWHLPRPATSAVRRQPVGVQQPAWRNLRSPKIDVRHR